MAYPCHAHSDSASEDFKISRACTTLPSAKIGGASEMKTKNFVFCFAFHSACTTLPSAKIGGASEMKTKNFVFCFAFHSACTIFADGTTKTKKQCFRFAARTTM